MERIAAIYFKQGRYGKSIAASMDSIPPSGLKRSIIQFFIGLIGEKKIEYPNDFLVEIPAVREMNFEDRLKDKI